MKNPVIRALCIAACILLLISLGWNIYAITNSGLTGAETFDCICLMLTAVFAIYYILAGAKKGEGTTYFRIFMVLYGFTVLEANFFFAELSSLVAMLNTLCFGCLSILFVAKNLGKKWSVALSLVVVACAIEQMIVYFDVATATNLLLALVALLMVFAKYADKAARGSK